MGFVGVAACLYKTETFHRMTNPVLFFSMEGYGVCDFMEI